MSLLDTFYRAFTDYRKTTREDRECIKLRRMFARVNAENDKITVIKTICNIEEDWVEAIEKGLVHIGKAIEEDRQFIRSNGEVVPIEKVKNVSRESVEHLARHSNLLTRVTEGEDLIPDQLYTVERLSDYAVYENRFLYMLLCYLRDFISFRYDKILTLANTYSGSLKMKKFADFDGRKTSYEVNFDEEILNDPFLSENNPAKEMIDRIDDILKNVMLYLSTPLMEFVSKYPMLKPPVTETNVLKMNKNFRGAMQLYYFITAYDKDGYTIERVTKTLNPLKDETADEFAENIALCSFLTYEHGMELESLLKDRYREEEAKRRALEEKQFLEKLENLKRRVKESGQSMEEYMLLLEQRNRSLEYDSAQLKTAEAEIEKLGVKVKTLEENLSAATLAAEEAKRALADQAEEHAKEVEGLKAAHNLAMSELRANHELEKAELNRVNAEKIASLSAECEQKISAVNAECEEKISALNTEHEEKIAAINEEFAAKSASYEERLAASAEENRLAAAANKEMASRVETLGEELTLTTAKYNAVRRQHGLFTSEDDFTSNKKFDEIERQYKAFKIFLREEWRKAKKRIRKEVFAEAKKASSADKAALNAQSLSATNGAPEENDASATGGSQEENKEEISQGLTTTDMSEEKLTEGKGGESAAAESRFSCAESEADKATDAVETKQTEKQNDGQAE